MFESGQGDFLGANTAPETLVALQHTDLVALPGKQGGTDQRINAAADNNKIIVLPGHAPTRV